MRITDAWVDQAAKVTAVLGILLLGAVVWGRHAHAVERRDRQVCAGTRGREIRTAAAPARRQRQTDANAGTTREDRPGGTLAAGDEVKTDRDRAPNSGGVENKAAAPLARQEAHRDTGPNVGDPAPRATPRHGSEQPASWLSLLPE